jgi:hypothetical protein
MAHRPHSLWTRAQATLPRRAFTASWLAAACSVALGCMPMDENGQFLPYDDVSSEQSALTGENLGGINVAAANFAGTNLGGINLGGINLGGHNLGGINMKGTNVGGNNLGGINMASSNLGGINLGGINLGGINLGGINMASSNLSGSNLGGINVAGNNLTGTNLGGINLGGINTGRNIHSLTGSINGMLYSAEDMWLPKTGQCIVVGLGSTAFPKLLGQQSLNAKISVALGKLPWGFSATSGGPVKNQAWEAIVWGDKTYCVFVMGAPPGSTWQGVAGFIKAVFRWNAPPTQTMEISGIEASAPHDPTLRTGIDTYTGMMDAGAKFRAGTLTEKAFMAGELAFATATTNNQSVMVDFSTWVQDKNKNALVLGNVTSGAGAPTYAEALYIALENTDGTVTIMLDDAASRAKVMPTGMTNSVVDLNDAYKAWQNGLGPKPVPRRCGGALYLNTWFGEPVPAGKCDEGLAWAPGFCVKGAEPWSKVTGTTAPMNGYMQLTALGGAYQRGLLSGSSCGTMRPVLSETYVHMWERNFDIPAGACTAESNASFCSRRGKNCGTVAGTDNCGTTRTVTCGSCASPQSCGGGGVSNVCGSSNSKIYEAEALGNALGGSTYVHACAEAYIKVLGAADPGVTAGACAGGARLRYLGGNTSNTMTFNKVNVPTAGTYTMTVYAGVNGTRSFDVSINGLSPVNVSMTGNDFGTPFAVTKNVTLKAGDNTLKFYNNSASTPDLDRIKITGNAVACVPESNTEFCARQVKNCGSLTASDNCGVSRTVSSCGSCASPQTCGGGGVANVCGAPASSGGTCATAYSQTQCLSFSAGSVVSKGGKNYTCTTANCRNCATNAGCEPGGTSCPYGVVWSETGTCSGGTGGGTGSTCATAFNKSSCISYLAGAVVSKNGRNWTCSNGNCANCGTYTSCEPGQTGCPWGTVWTDSGACQ